MSIRARLTVVVCAAAVLAACHPGDVDVVYDRGISADIAGTLDHGPSSLAPGATIGAAPPGLVGR